MVTAYNPVSAPPCAGHAQVGLLRLATWTANVWGGTNLGIYACRGIRNGRNESSSSYSVHADGRALDWRMHAPVGTPTFFRAREARRRLESYWKVLIANSDVLGVQVIHDYQKQLRWQTGRGWYRANIGAGAGGATTHVERNWAGARDARTIVEIIGTQRPPTQPGQEADMSYAQSFECPAGTSEHPGRVSIGLPIHRASARLVVFCDGEAGSGASLWGTQIFDEPSDPQGLWGNGGQWELWVPARKAVGADVRPEAWQVRIENRGPKPITVSLSGDLK